MNRQRHEPLLGAVVHVALKPSPLLDRGCREPLSTGPEFRGLLTHLLDAGPQLRSQRHAVQGRSRLRGEVGQ